MSCHCDTDKSEPSSIDPRQITKNKRKNVNRWVGPRKFFFKIFKRALDPEKGWGWGPLLFYHQNVVLLR